MQRDSTHRLFVFLLGVDIICFQGKLQQQASFIFCVRLASRMEKCEPREQNEQNLDHIKSRANASFDSEICYILLDLAKRTSLCKDKRGMKGQLLFQRIEASPRPPRNSARHRFSAWGGCPGAPTGCIPENAPRPTMTSSLEDLTQLGHTRSEDITSTWLLTMTPSWKPV